jgi:hypothetical protein
VLLTMTTGSGTACRIPFEVIKERAKYRKHVTGFIARATDELLSHRAFST